MVNFPNGEPPAGEAPNVEASPEGIVAVAPTPLEEIEEEENAPEDFFDLQALEIPEALPPLDARPEGPLAPEVTYDVPIVFNEVVKEYIVFFQTRLRDHFEVWLARSGRYIPMMQAILKKHELPEDLVFLALIESGFNPKAFSRAKAAGPWQFIQGTGKKYGLRIDQWIDERRDPAKSTVAAAKYLKDLYRMFGSWPLSMASYNAGEGRIMRAMARTRAEDFWELKASRHIHRETKNYVPKFMAATIIAKSPQKYGFSIEYSDPLLYEESPIPKATSIKTIAKAAGVSLEDIKALNPELKKGVTPPNYPRYQIKLPPGTKETFVKNFVPSKEKEISVGELEKHRITKGETLSSIARKYGVSIRRLQEANQLKKESRIHAGQTIMIPLDK